MHRHLIHIYILFFCFVTRISGEKSKKVDAKIERRQAMVDMRYEYPHAAFLNGLQGTFGISGDQYDNNPDEAGLGIILGAKSLFNGHYQHALNRPVQVVVPFAVHQPVAVPVSSYRAVPVANIRPGVNIHRPIPVHYPNWKHLHRNQYQGQNGLKVKKYPNAGKAPLQTSVKYTSVVNQEPNYIVFHGNSDAAVPQPSLGNAYQDAANAVLTNSVFAGFPAPQMHQEIVVPQYVAPHIKLNQVTPKLPANAEPAQGLGQYATTHNIPQYEYANNRIPVYVTTPNYEYSSESYEASNGNSEYDSKQNVKPQTYTSLVETKNSAQDDSRGSNSVPSSNYEQYVAGPNYESYEDRRSSPESYSEQYQYQYYTSGNNQEADSETQSSNQVKYGTAHKYQQRYF